MIGGFTPPEGTRQHFGALLVGYYEDGKLQFAGKVGTGFNAAHSQIAASENATIGTRNLPVCESAERTQGKWKQNITPGEMRHCHWVAGLSRSLRPIGDQLADDLARFAGYPDRFAGALERVDQGQRNWVDGTRIDSCHTVWFELHEDLLSTLGLERGEGA